MALEIERKFLVTSNAWRSLAPGVLYRQGYLSSHKERTVRVRIAGNQAFLTVKGITTGATRHEYEYPIPVQDASEMLDGLAEHPLIEKWRYRIPAGPHTWEVDEFLGVNTGLVVAEIELGHEDEPFDRPDWIGEEVTDDARYYNANLVVRPYQSWSHIPRR